MLILYMCLLKQILLMESCCLGVTLGMFVHAIITFGFSDGNPYYAWYLRMRVFRILFVHLIWLAVLVYSSIKFADGLYMDKVMVVLVYILSFWCGKPIILIMERKQSSSSKWYVPIIYYLVHILHIFFLMNIAICFWVKGIM